MKKTVKCWVRFAIAGEMRRMFHWSNQEAKRDKFPGERIVPATLTYEVPEAKAKKRGGKS